MRASWFAIAAIFPHAYGEDMMTLALEESLPR
jgi:hypothetical protein